MRLLVVLVTVSAVVTACSGASHRSSAPPPTSTVPAPTTPRPPPTTRPAPTTVPTTRPAPSHALVPASLGSGGPVTLPPTGSGVLSGKIVAVDPGHNGGNYRDPGYINSAVWNGREEEACDTTGTETDAGYTEALFNWNVARWVADDLRAEGATVILTRSTNTGVGPCITERAAIANNAHAAAAVSIHADGGPPSGRGFAILEPVADGPNDGVIAASRRLGQDLRSAFLAGTGEPVSNYDGVNGIQPRDDLGGTNLTTVPKVFIECANMRNPTDAALLVRPAWQHEVGNAIAAGLTAFLAGR